MFMLSICFSDLPIYALVFSLTFFNHSKLKLKSLLIHVHKLYTLNALGE